MRAFCLVMVSLLILLLWLPTSSFARAPVAKTITVDQKGEGDFTTVQSAVDSVPDGNSEWVRIHVKEGSYREKVNIPNTKGYILLEGEGSSKTDINFGDHAQSNMDMLIRSRSKIERSQTFLSATFTVLADNFVARNIAFKNTYNEFDKSKSRPAVALLVGGNNSAFYDCAFHGFQDTLCDFTGRHYFRRCLVVGGVDFIWGYGQSIYEDCTIVSNMPPSSHQPGWITAHARLNASSSGGLVFKGGRVQGTGRQFLGRGWNHYSTVVFYGVQMADIVVPQGWEAWKAEGDVSHVTFAEIGCTGPGSNVAGRVPWEKRLTEEEAQAFVDMKYIDDGWLSEQP